MIATLPTIEALVAGFLSCKETEGRSPKTVSWYRDNLVRFCRYIAKTAPGASVSDIRLSEARNFVHYLQNDVVRWENNAAIHDTQGLAATTVRGYVRTLKVFWNWLADKGYIENSPFVRLRQP